MINQAKQPRKPRRQLEPELQQSDHHGKIRDDELKRIVRQHPQRDIPRLESVEPPEAPPKE